MMAKGRPFVHVFLSYFVPITLIFIIIFIFVSMAIMEGVFARYEATVHAETRQTIAARVLMYYMVHYSWEGYDAFEVGESAKLSGDYFTLKDTQGNIVYSTEKTDRRCCENESHKYINFPMPLYVSGEFVGTLTAGYFSGHIPSRGGEAFREKGLALIVLSVIIINLVSAAFTAFIFYALSNPLKSIARAAGDISGGNYRPRIKTRGKVIEMNDIASSINFLGESLIMQENFRRKFSSILSHELRTPMHILLSQSEAILDGVYELNSKRMAAMREEIIRIVKLLDELEDRLIYYNENFTIVAELVDISALVRTIACGYEGSFAKKGLGFYRHIEEGVTGLADKSRFAQMLVNIISNALKYTDIGEIFLSLRKLEKGGAILSVKDTGKGIDEEYLGYVFDCFFHLDSGQESRGIGLYIVKLIADKHGWKLNIKSKKGSGTTVEVFIK